MTGREAVMDRILDVQRVYGPHTGEADGLLWALEHATIPEWVADGVCPANAAYRREFQVGFEDGRSLLRAYGVEPPQVAA